MIPVFTSLDDKYRRLDGCFALVGDVPYVINAHPNNDLKPEEVYGMKFNSRSRDYDKLNYTDPGVRIKDLPLGYVDLNSCGVYVTRHPARTTSVGPSKNNLMYDAGRGQGFYNYCNNYGYQTLLNLFTKKYVGMEEAVGRVTSGASSVPLSNEIAIVKVGPRMYALHYKETTVGYTKDLAEPFDVFLPKGFINLVGEKFTKVGVNVKSN